MLLPAPQSCPPLYSESIWVPEQGDPTQTGGKGRTSTFTAPLSGHLQKCLQLPFQTHLSPAASSCHPCPYTLSAQLWYCWEIMLGQHWQHGLAPKPMADILAPASFTRLKTFPSCMKLMRLLHSEAETALEAEGNPKVKLQARCALCTAVVQALTVPEPAAAW